MDSSDGHSDVSDGSGSGRETRRTKGTDGSRDKGPRWSCIKETFQDWLWETEPVWDAMGLHKTYTGQNRDDSEFQLGEKGCACRPPFCLVRPNDRMQP